MLCLSQTVSALSLSLAPVLPLQHLQLCRQRYLRTSLLGTNIAISGCGWQLVWMVVSVVTVIWAAGSVQGPPQYVSDKDTTLALEGLYEAPSTSAAPAAPTAAGSHPGLLSCFSWSLGFQIISNAKCVFGLRGSVTPQQNLHGACPRA